MVPNKIGPFSIQDRLDSWQNPLARHAIGKDGGPGQGPVLDLVIAEIKFPQGVAVNDPFGHGSNGFQPDPVPGPGDLQTRVVQGHAITDPFHGYPQPRYELQPP